MPFMKQGPPGSTAPVLSPGVIRIFNASYGFSGYSLADPRISPLKADYSNFKGKKVCVITGEYDNLCQHGQMTAKKMKDEGVDVSEILIQGAFFFYLYCEPRVSTFLPPL